MKHQLLTIAVCLVTAAACAQESSQRYWDSAETWKGSGNAALLSLDALPDHGYAEFSGQRREGSYHRVQEGTSTNSLTFETRRYQKISGLLTGYGSFAFDNSRTKGRAWADVMRPYDATPYYPGSRLPGRYDRQTIAMQAVLATRPLLFRSEDGSDGLRAGLDFAYAVSDLSRLRDPRSRSELLDYRLAPALSLTRGGHTVGLSPSYERRKEKIPNMKTVQDDPNLEYYELRGLDQGVGAVGYYKGFSRQWTDHRLGLSLAYDYRLDHQKSTTSIAFESGREEALEQEKANPAVYRTMKYALHSKNSVASGHLLHTLTLDITTQRGLGDEHHQQRVQTNDATTGTASYHYETVIDYRKRYQQDISQGTFAYRLSHLASQATDRYAGFGFSLYTNEQTHRLPLSTFSRQRFVLSAEGGTALAGQHLWIDATLGYAFTGTKADDMALAEPQMAFAQDVLLRDIAFYTADYWQFGLQAKYLFGFRLKGMASTAYLKASANYLRTQGTHMENRLFGLTLGIMN